MNLDSAEQENEVESSKILRDRWQKAFPFASFAPVLQEPTEEDRRLARMFCPQLHVWPNLFVQERKFLSKSIGSIACAESFFLHTLGSFPEDTSGAEFYLLSSAKERIENNKHRESLYTNIPGAGKIYENSELHRLLEEKCDKTLMNKARDKAIELFEEHFPQEGPTCAIKYRVVHSPTNPSLYCIQYFTYWPVQISPFHMFDYEPVYVFVKKETDPKKTNILYHTQFEPLLIVFNANPGNILKQLKPVASLKRPGHLIRTFINWDSSLRFSFVDPMQFNSMANYMTKAYGDPYSYQELNSWQESHIGRVFSFNGKRTLRPQLAVVTPWHAYDIANQTFHLELQAVDCEPKPLKTEDLYHIEWDLRSPFKAPFLYPLVGKKPFMHFPFNMNTLCDDSTTGVNHVWHMFAEVLGKAKDLETTKGFAEYCKFEDYRCGLLVKLLAELQNQSEPSELWNKIDIFAEKRQKFHSWYVYSRSLDKTIERSEDSVAYYAKGAFKSEKAPEEALNYYNKAIELDPSNPVFFFCRAEHYLKKLYRPRDAMRDFLATIELDPNAIQAFFWCGFILDFSNKPDAAREYFNNAIKLLTKVIESNPSDFIAYSSRADTFCTMNPPKLEEALEDYDQTLKLAPQGSELVPEMLYQKARCLSRLNRVKETIETLEEFSSKTEGVQWIERVESQEDFNNIRNNSDFANWVKMKKQKKTAHAGCQGVARKRSFRLG